MNVFQNWESEIRGYCRSMPAVFDTAANARQTDENGRSYIDFFAGAGVLNFGHNDPKMVQALIEYLQGGGVVHSLDMHTTAKRTFIQRFVDVILKPREMDYKLQFTGPTGTNAVEAALKLARKVTGRRDIIAFTNGFHGMTAGALAATGNSYHRAAAGIPLNHVHRVPFDGYLGEGVDTLAAVRKMLKDPSSGITAPAAFILETIQAEGGVNVASPEFLKAVQDLAHEHGALFIVDDIQVGCGRTGSYFSFDGMDLDPDIVVLAKGIGGLGIPLAMLLVRRDRDAWSPGEHTGTFRGQDLSFVAGTVALDYFTDDALMNDVKRRSKTIAEAIAPLGEHEGVDLRQRGMIAGIDVGTGEAAKTMAGRMYDNGVLLSPCGPKGNVLKILPPLTIPDDDLEAGLDVVVKAVQGGAA